MENLDETIEMQETPKLVVTEEMRSYFYEMAKWANFLAILGFVFAGFMIITAFTIGGQMSRNPQLVKMMAELGAAGGVVFTVIFLLFAFAIFYPSLLLFKYSTKAKLGVLYGEQASLQFAVGKLKSLFKYWGIISIVYIALNILMIISQVMAGGAKV